MLLPAAKPPFPRKEKRLSSRAAAQQQTQLGVIP